MVVLAKRPLLRDEQLYNSVNDHESMRQFKAHLLQLLADDVKFTVHDVVSACSVG